MSGGVLTLQKKDGSGTYRKGVAIGEDLKIVGKVNVTDKVVAGFGEFGKSKAFQPIRVFAGSRVFEAVRQEVEAYRASHGGNEPTGADPLMISGLAVSFDKVIGQDGTVEKTEKGAEKKMIVVRGFASEVEVKAEQSNDHDELEASLGGFEP